MNKCAAIGEIPISTIAGASTTDSTTERDYRKWGRPGIRAQLLDVTKRRLEMDFVLEGDERSMHVLNAVSPAFTCSLPFADHVCDRVEAAFGGVC
jgi:L-2-hydroxyglutarate oxidase LhgO